MYGYKALIWDPVSGCAVSPIELSVWRGRFAQATCGRAAFIPDGEAPAHQAPDEACGCGIHATGMVLWLLDYAGNAGLGAYGGRCFTALLRASGKVIEYSMGWRAEAVEIIGVGCAPTIMGAPHRFAEAAAEALGVPFEPALRSLGYLALELERAQSADQKAGCQGQAGELPIGLAPRHPKQRLASGRS